MEKKEKKKSNKLMRVISGLVLFPGFAAIMIFSNNLIFDIFVGIIGMMCLYEFFTCFKKGEKARPFRVVGYLMMLVLTAASIFINAFNQELLNINALTRVGLVGAIIAAVLLLSLIILTIILVLYNGKRNIVDYMVTFAGIAYIGISLFLATELRAFTKLDINIQFNNPRLLFWYIFIAAWGTDMFAYFIGSKIGKHKFTEISPKKSIEGLVGGVFGTLLLGFLYTLIVMQATEFTIVLIIGMILLFVVLSLIGQIGDIFASSIKRYNDVKDYSNLIPGHGGMMDRIDSVIFIVPVAYIVATVIQIVTTMN